MMPSKMPTKRPSFMLSVTAESNDSSPVPSSPPSTGFYLFLLLNIPRLFWVKWLEMFGFNGFFAFVGGESFEGFGENDTSEQVSGSGIDLVLAPHINSTPNNQYVFEIHFFFQE